MHLIVSICALPPVMQQVFVLLHTNLSGAPEKVWCACSPSARHYNNPLNGRQYPSAVSDQVASRLPCDRLVALITCCGNGAETPHMAV